MATGTSQARELTPLGGGVFVAKGARIIDRSGRRRMPIGYGDFLAAMNVGTLVDKTALIADVLDRAYAAMLFCRPRRFGKTLNITMLKAFLEAPEAGGLSREEAEAVFEHTDVWDADGGAYRQYQGAYPVVHMSLNTSAKETWPSCYGAIKDAVAKEYLRHGYLRTGGTLQAAEEDYFDRMASKRATEDDVASSLATLCEMLAKYHGQGTVLLIDEYDAPVMAGYTHAYYDRVVDFMRTWLTGAVKNGGTSVKFSCLTGVQRISKESIFSGLNNLYVDTPLSSRFEERYGFTDKEVEALASYQGHPDCTSEVREWYDGYRFGRADVYNPWSVISYFNADCMPSVYWLNTSDNSIVGNLVANADLETLDDVYTLLRPGGVVREPLDLGVVFPDIGVREGALWSMLYLAGYLTTDDVDDPGDDMRLRPLRLPDREVSKVFGNEVIRRFRAQAGGSRRLSDFQDSMLRGDEEAFGRELSRIALRASVFDLTGELPCHMLLMGLLFGVPGYLYPISNREAGYGRYDIRLEPDPAIRTDVPRPLVTMEVKYLRFEEAPGEAGAREAALRGLAHEALAQVAGRAYDADLPACADGRLRWGVAFSGKRVAVACERIDCYDEMSHAGGEGRTVP